MKEQEAMENPGLWVFKNCTPAVLGFYDFSEGENHILKPTFYKRERLWFYMPRKWDRGMLLLF